MKWARAGACVLVIGLALQVVTVAAQSTPSRIVQTSDGTLYLLKDGARYQIQPDPISDTDLSSYRLAGAIGAQIPAGASTSAPAASGGALASDSIVTALQSSGQPVTDVVIYTADTDLNHLLGRPNQYIAKVSWTDTRAPDQKTAATVELFPDVASLDARQKYTRAISDTGGPFAQYIYRNDARLALMRLPGELTPDQASQYQAWFSGL